MQYLQELDREEEEEERQKEKEREQVKFSFNYAWLKKKENNKQLLLGVVPLYLNALRFSKVTAIFLKNKLQTRLVFKLENILPF